jgi:hypothetical protein
MQHKPKGGAMSNRQMEERAELRQDEVLADELGLTVEELETVGYELETVCSDDGHPNYTLVRFLNSSQKEVLDKISGLSNMTVQVSLNTFDEDDYCENYEE